MGYDTKFRGEFAITPPLRPEHAAYLRAFSRTRRMKRNEFLTVKRPDPVREAVGLPVGEQGCYFVGEGGYAGQGNGPDVVGHNQTPRGQPNYWCKWEPNEAGTALRWNGVEKFYDYAEWLEYLIAHFLAPWGYTLDGTVRWQGEEEGDVGRLVVTRNDVRAVPLSVAVE